MANGDNPSGFREGSLSVGHGIGLSVGVAVFSVVITVAGMTVYLGGWLRQIEVNTGRLDRLETIGSPALKSLSVELDIAVKRLNITEDRTRDLPARDATIAAEIADLKRATLAIQHDFRSREFWEHLASEIARAQIQIQELNGVRERGVQEWATIVQRIATLEADAKELQSRVSMVRDHMADHEKEDMTLLRDRMSELVRELEVLRRPK